MLRVRSITPIDVPPDELVRRQERYDRLTPPPVTVTLHNIGDGAPTALNTEADIRASDQRVTELASATDPERFDVVVPDCVLDPGVDGDAPVPVVGLLRLAAGHCGAFGLPFGSVTRNPAIGAELARRLRQYGLDRHHVGNDVLALDIEAIADDRRWQAALAAARDRFAQRGAAAVLNGCSAVDLADPQDESATAVASTTAPVVFDPTRLALQLLAAGHRAGFAVAGGRGRVLRVRT